MSRKPGPRCKSSRYPLVSLRFAPCPGSQLIDSIFVSYQRDTTLAVIRDVERKLLRCHRTKLQIARWLDGERCPDKYKLNALHASEVESLTRGQKPASLTVLQKNVHALTAKEALVVGISSTMQTICMTAPSSSA